MALGWMTKPSDGLTSGERLGTAGMVTAAALVGVAIAADGSAARLFNGVGGLLWLGSFAHNAWSVRRSPHREWSGVLVLGSSLVLAVGIKPHDPLLALLGFGAAGALVAGLGARPAVTWALLVPGAWLPLHIGIAIARAVMNSATEGAVAVRTDPPPTAAIVPLVMVAAAIAGGWIVQRILVLGRERSATIRSGSGAD